MRLNAKHCLIVAALGFASKAQANPIYVDDTIPVLASSCVAIVAEVVVAGMILGALRSKRALFIFFAIGVHLLTYPLFVAISLYFNRTHYGTETGVAIGEALICAIEALAYFIYAKWAKVEVSIRRCALASIAGNVTSVILGVVLYLVLIQFRQEPQPWITPHPSSTSSHNQSLERTAIAAVRPTSS